VKIFNFHIPPKKKATALEVARMQLKIHEGLRLKAYNDTVGVLTIGYGRNLTNGIRQDEAELMLANDVREAEVIAKKFAADAWDKLNVARQAVLINMAFNLGETRLFQFIRMKQAVRRLDFVAVAESMRASLWYRQVKGRGEELVKQMETGEL